MDLQAIRLDRAAGSVEYMGEVLTFKYRPALITPNTYASLSEAKDVDELSSFFGELLVSWDLKKGGEPVEPTKDVVAELPMALLRLIAQFIQKEVPQKEVGKD